jgi:HD-like signal output (HDOD) protein
LTPTKGRGFSLTGVLRGQEADRSPVVRAEQNIVTEEYMNNLPPIEIDPDQFLREHCALPALPSVVIKIQKLIEGGDADMGSVADLISGEPSLVAQVLKVANSAYYGLSRDITKVKFAIAFLGLNEIYRMVLSLSVVNTLAIDEKDQLTKFWFHSFYTALSTKYLAKKFEPHLSFEELWSAAILHDIGKLVYLKFFPDHFKALTLFAREKGCPLSSAERHFSLPASALFGTMLCNHWRLPDHIKSACEKHSLADLTGIDKNQKLGRFQRMICLGNLLTVLSTDELNDSAKQEVAEAIRNNLDCEESAFLAMMGDIYELRIDVERFTEQFG